MLKKLILSLVVTMTAIVSLAILPFGDSHTVGYYNSNARVLLKNKDFSAAQKLLERGLKDYPTASGLNGMMGRIYYERKLFDKARYYLFRAVREDRENREAKQLLVNVEEFTGNYSSAICYINELLQMAPYEKTLWIKKIGIYRIQGNHVEADRLLRRLVQVYPSDKSLVRRFQGRVEENVAAARKSGKLGDAIANLRQLVRLSPNDPANYLQLSNLQLQAGLSEEALATVGEGLQASPGNAALAEKRVGILAGLHRYAEALEFLTTHLRSHPNARLASMVSGLRESAAADAMAADPYVAYGRLYESSKSTEALNFMLNTSVVRGYVSDALYYLGEARKRQGNTPGLLYKEFEIYKRIGDDRKAVALLEKLLRLQPRNAEVADELASFRLRQASDLMVTMDYVEAIPLLDFVARRATDRELVQSAMNKKYTCYFETRRYKDASALLDTIHARFPKQPRNYYVQRATLLAQQGKSIEALALLENALDSTSTDDNHALYLSTYETIAVPFIKNLIAVGAAKTAMDASERFLRIMPSSHDGLLYAINCAALLRRDIDYGQYTQMALNYYPDDVAFRVKRAAYLGSRKRYDEALGQLRPWLDTYVGDSILIGSFSAHSELLAHTHIKRHEGRRAIAVLDSALLYDSANRTLLYTKGLAYESMKQYDSAYVYQKYYQPSLMEVSGHKLHLDELSTKDADNLLSLEYRRARYGEADVMTAAAMVGYTRKLERNAYTARLSYAGRDGRDGGETAESYAPGGVGLQAQLEWEHTFSDKWSGMVNAAVANRYFPSFSANARLQRTLPYDWVADVHAGYRRVETNMRDFSFNQNTQEWQFSHWNTDHKHMLNLGVGATKSFDQFSLGGKADLVSYAGKLCYSGVVVGKYFPLQSRLLDLTASAGISSAPETTILDAALPGTFDKTNTMVSLGGSYLLFHNMTFRLEGIWNTFTNTTVSPEPADSNNPTAGFYNVFTTSYKNLFHVDASLIISF